jgi:purine-binding chemotaxis protein CheW
VAKQQYTTCVVDDLLVGIKVEALQEVSAASELTPVPLASSLVSGLLNLRGHVITAVDLRRCLQLRDRPAGQRPVHVIMRTADGLVSLLVDQVGDVFQVDDADCEPAPSTLDGRLRDLIAGAYELSGRLLLVLDTERALAFSSHQQT